MRIFLRGKNFKYFFGCLIFPIFLAANGGCWAQSYVLRKRDPHTLTLGHSLWREVASWRIEIISGDFLLIIHVLNLNICWSRLYGRSANSIFWSSKWSVIVVKLWVNPTIVFNPVIGSPVAQWHSAWLETVGPRVRASPASLRCVIEQGTLILA